MLETYTVTDLVNQGSEVAHRDRVSQVYFGMLEWGLSGEILRRRINWMVDHVQGSNILDVGCSEGVLEILLARKGFNVTGVDVNAAALNFARELLARESEDVQQRVRFVQGDLAQTRLLDEQFDTLVMGEILEHLRNPETLLHRSLNLIRPDGRLIVTTPFGYHPHDDHRQTFCLSSFLRLAKPHCSVDSLEIEEGYIRMIGRILSPGEGVTQSLTSKQLLSITEKALVSSQQRLYSTIDRYKGRQYTLDKQISAEKERASKLENRFVVEIGKTNRFRKEVEARKAKTAALQQEVETVKAKATALKQYVETGKARTTALRQEVEAGRRMATALRQEVEAEQVKLTELQQDAEADKSKITALLRRLETGKAEETKLTQVVTRLTKREAQLKRSIRWKLGTLFVDVARRPWRVIRLPGDIVRLSVVFLRRRKSMSTTSGSSETSSRPTSSINPRPNNMRAAAPLAVPPAEIPPTTRSLELSASHQMMTEWIMEQVEGQGVAVIGCDDSSLLKSLAELGFRVTRREFRSLGVDPVGPRTERTSAAQTAPEWKLSGSGAAREVDGDTDPFGTIDSTIIFDIFQADAEPRSILGCVRDRLSQPEGKLIIVQPRFEVLPRDGEKSILPSLLPALRTTTVPQDLSLADAELRFVGRFGRPSSEQWPQFESEIWPQLMHEAVQSLQSRHRREVGTLEQRVQDLLESTSYKAGRILVASAQEPRALWKAPGRLWRLYRSSKLRTRLRTVKHSKSIPTAAVSIPAFTPPPARPNAAPTVAAILDTFSEHCLRYEADLVLLKPKHWRRQLSQAQPLFLLVESAWRGNDGAWRHLLTNYTTRDVNPLRELVAYCHEHSITTVFWNKEDPPNFDVFIDVAKEFDFVFTTDADCILKYKKICGHNRIHLMPFASQPRLHNPCRETSWPTYPVCFAGSWMEKYPERGQSMNNLLGPALAFDLHIFDRNFKVTGHDPRYRFPDRYQSSIKGSLEYERMLTAYRCYDVMLNVNSVTDSPTMFSRRVFESLACGTPVISTDSVGLRLALGKHVRITRSPQDTTAHLEELLNDEERRMREGHLGYRHVHEHHTYGQRMKEMFRQIGVETEMSTRRPSVSVIVATCLPQNLNFAIANYERQLYEEKELLLLLSSASFDMEAIAAHVKRLKNVRIIRLDGHPSLGEVLNKGVEEASGDYVAKMDDGDHYGKRYLSDMMLAAQFSDADILGKGTYFVHLKSKNVMALRSITGPHEYTEFVAGATLTGRKQVMREIGFPDRTGGEDSSLLARASEAGCRIYSADPFNILVTREMDRQSHTWNIDESEFLKNCRNIRSSVEWERVMI